MSGEANRRNPFGPADSGWMIVLVALIGVVTVGVILWLGAMLNPTVQALPRHDPFSVFKAFFDGDVASSGGQIAATAAMLIILAGAGVGVWAIVRRTRRRRSRIDYKARFMAKPEDLRRYMGREALRDAERLGATRTGVGVPIAADITTGQPLYALWEWVMITIMGPRAGKTSTMCVRQILETNGPVLATSNKRDIVDLTRGPRTERGVAWVHDVQGIIGEPPDWWWNPLSFVKDMETAEKLTAIFQSSVESAGDKQDAYFSSAGRETLSRLFLAAALDGRPITDVFRWANRPDEKTDDPARILIAHGEVAQGRALGETQNLTEKQRDGVYGTIRPWIGLLGNRRILPWITDPGMTRPHFNPAAFVTSTDTIYLISAEGGGTARAITGALTMAILEAAERIGASQRGGRLSTPLVAVLDEAANVCRWRELPDKYSHYGSRGIILCTYFQSWQQGVEAYGETGMGKLWSAANVRIVGSGLSEDRYLQFVSQAVGEYDALKRSRASQGHGASVTSSLNRERIFDVADITALPHGRALMLATQTPPALLKLEHYSTKPYAAKVRASQEYFESIAMTIANAPAKENTHG